MKSKQISALQGKLTLKLSGLFPGSLFFVFLFLSLEVQGQFKFRETPNRQAPSPLQWSDGQALWDQFLQTRQFAQFVIEGQLVFRPPDRASERYRFLLEADWNKDFEDSQLTLVAPTGETSFRSVRLERSVSEIYYRDSEGEDWSSVNGEWLERTVCQGLALTWQDLLMPFLNWDTVEYVGPLRFLGRPAHRFQLNNPEVDKEPAFVRVVLDEDFASLLEVDIFSTDEKRLKHIRVAGFKQFGEAWMFSSLVWENQSDRSSVRLSVENYRLKSQ